MKKVVVFFSLLMLAHLVGAQGLTLPSNSVATTDNVLSTVTNPAWLGYRPGAELMLLFPYTGLSTTNDMDKGFMVKLGPLGFSGEFVDNGLELYNRYTLASGFKLAKWLYGGTSYSWYRAVDWEGSWNFGLGIRPLPFVSAGAVFNDLNTPFRGGVEVDPSAGLSLALRPLGRRLTISEDVLISKTSEHDYGEKLKPRLRVEIEPLDGIRLTGEYQTDDQFFGAGISFAVDKVGLGHFRTMEESGQHLSSVGYLHLTSAMQPSIFAPKSHQIVEITLSGVIRESEPAFSFFAGGKAKTLHELRREIQHYADDPRVDGLLINFQGAGLGLAQAQQLRRSLEDFRATGKKLMAYSEAYSQRDYFLATVCDEIYLLPVGDVDLKGLASVRGYWKGTLDKLGIGIQVVRVRDYKTAANELIFEETPEAEAQMLNWLLDDIYSILCTKIGEGRNWTTDEVKAKVDAGPYTGKWALEAGLVDSLKYYDEITKRLRDEKFVLVGDESYWKRGDYNEDWPDLRTPKVAVIYAEGAIVSGESGQNFFGTTYMGSETIAEAIRKAREDRSVDAIILRVDSPGGSGLASDVIYREVRRTTEDKKHRKPIIVSMGNVAGSGGYYISCAADTIIAEEGTITGSIGVIALKPNFQSLHKKIHYNTNTFKRGEHADAYSLARPFSDEEMQILKDAIEDFYGDFLTKVAQGRGMDTAAVDSIAEGRVWTGQQAKDRGLVDLIGGMDLAFEIVRSQLGVESGAALDLQFSPEHHGFFTNIAYNMMNIGHRPLPKGLTEVLEPIYLAAELYDGEPLLLMPFYLDIK